MLDAKRCSDGGGGAAVPQGSGLAEGRHARGGGEADEAPVFRLEEDCGGEAGRLRVRATASKGTCALDCLHLAPRYNHLAARLLYHALCFDETGRPTPLGG